MTGLLVRERCNLDILSVKMDAKLSAGEMPEKEEGNGEEDLQCSSLFTVCQRRFGLAESRIDIIVCWCHTVRMPNFIASCS